MYSGIHVHKTNINGGCGGIEDVWWKKTVDFTVMCCWEKHKPWGF